MKKRISLVLIVVLDYFIGIYLVQYPHRRRRGPRLGSAEREGV